ncbi:MAG: hypothetical protein ABSC18_09160 [Verrucomicrobiota bacterium]|jgi:hypothetical protein
MKRIVVLWVFLFGFLSLARSQGVAVSAELSLEKDQLLPDEKMRLKLSIQNRSGQDLLLGTESNWLTFTVLGEKSTEAPPLGTDQEYMDGETIVPSGKSASREFNLTPHFDFRQPGRYAVKATIKIPQWHQEVAVPPAPFTIVKGIRLNLPDIDMPVGVPFLQGRDGQPPEIRRYFLEKSEAPAGAQLYVRLTDATGSRTERLVPIGSFLSYSQPDVKLDMYNDLHVLHQTGARVSTYCVIDTLGQILERQTYQYTDRRPALLADGKGGVIVSGGARVVSASDLPPPQETSSTPPANPDFPGGKPGMKQDK